MNIIQKTIQSPIGCIQMNASEVGLTSVLLVSQLESKIERNVHLEQAEIQLFEYFNGQRKTFDLHIDISGYTLFQQDVWRALQQIPWGKTISYLDLAKKMGDPKKIRAVAHANAKNPMLVIIPCHRVIGKNGDLVGYSGGLEAKKWLLDFESDQKSLFS